jgi:peptide/nickel transport system substrate-binding protein
MNADDVVWSYKRVLDPATGSPARPVFSLVDSINKIDNYTVRFSLNAPFAEFPTLVGGSFQARIAPSDVSDLRKNPTGTGPFKFKEFVPGDHTTLIRNEAYWRDGEPYLDRVDYLTIPEEAGHVAALLDGSIDMSWWPSGEVLPQYQASKDINVLQVPTNGYQPIVMAVDMPPFNDKRVRQAFRLICDRAALKRIVLGDLPVALSNDHPIPPNSPYYMPQTPLQQDIERAKALLAEAGYKDGMDIEMVANTGRPGLVQTALAYQDMAKKANVRIAVKSVTSDVFLSSYWLKHNFYATQWNARTTMYELLAIAYYSNAKWNESHWKTPEMDRLIDGVRSEQNEEKRKAIFWDIQKMFIAESPVIIPFHKPRVTALRKRVQGFQAHPSAWVDLRTVWLS